MRTLFFVFCIYSLSIFSQSYDIYNIQENSISKVSVYDLKELNNKHVPYMVLSRDMVNVLNGQDKKNETKSNSISLSKSTTNYQKAALIISSSDYNNFQGEINTYKQDVESIFNAEILIEPGEWSNHIQLRQFIKNLWLTDHITGIILVGNLPYAKWKFPFDDNCVLPYYYEDLDGEFIDRNNDGYYDYHLFINNNGPEVWESIIRPVNNSEIGLFFDKCHSYFQDELNIPRKGHIYINKDWGSVVPVIQDNMKKVFSDSIEVFGGTDIQLDGQSYLNSLDKGYSINNLWVHSSETFHQFDIGPHQYVYQSEIKSLNQSSLFSIIWGCHAFNYYNNDNFGNAYTIGNNLTQCALGAVRSIGIEKTENFLDMLHYNDTLITCYVEYLKTIYDSVNIANMFPLDTVNCFIWDYVLYGNPFIIIKRHVESPELNSPTNNSLVKDSTFILLWENISNAIGFKLQIALDSEFTNIVYTDKINNEECPSPKLEGKNKYFWRVKAFGPSDTSNWSKFFSFKTDNIVPVELVSFSAHVNENCVSLIWKTETEVNNSNFEIERKSSNNNWQKISSIKGNGTTTNGKTYSFVDRNLSPGKYSYKLKQIDLDGSFEYSKKIEVTIKSPENYVLNQNYPNPFNPTTRISYSIPLISFVTLKIFDVLGNVIATLVNDTKQAGYYEVKFDGKNISSGVYIYRMQAGGFISAKKLILMK